MPLVVEPAQPNRTPGPALRAALKLTTALAPLTLRDSHFVTVGRTSLIATLALAGLLAVAAPYHAEAQVAGVDTAGGDGGAGSGAGGMGGVLNQGPGAAGSNAGGGGGGPQLNNTIPRAGGAGNGTGTNGGSSGLNGSSDPTAGPITGQAGNDGTAVASTQTPSGAGGGGAGGFGLVLTGTAQFATQARITGGAGGNGGSGYGDSTYGANGGNGGDGGVGIYIGGSTTLTASSAYAATGGAGGFGGTSIGPGAVDGTGGNGGAGAFIDAGSNALFNEQTVTGGDGAASYGTGLAGQGGAGVVVLSGGFLFNGGAVTGGAGGFGYGTAGGAGGEGVYSNGGTVTNESTITGGAAGSGSIANGSDGIFAIGSTITNDGTVTGGNGSATGGNGILATNTTITNTGTVSGGVSLADQPAGYGITGSGLTVVNSGTISGGLGPLDVYADAVHFLAADGTSNSIELDAPTANVNPTFIGNVVAGSTADIFILGGANNATFDTSQLGEADSVSEFQGFGTYYKTGSSTWTLTNAPNTATPWTVFEGTLAISEDANLDAAENPSPLTLNGGALETTADITTAREIILGSNNGTINTDGGTAFEVDGLVSGPGSLTKIGDGTLVLTNTNTYQGGTAFNGGVVVASSDANLGDTAGPLSFDGGTLQFGASFDLATTRTVTLNEGGGTIDTQTFTTTIGSSIGGTGALTKIGAGTLGLDAANTYTGDTFLRLGTIAVGDSAALGGGTLQMDEGTTLQFSTNGLNVPNNIVFTGNDDPTIDTGANFETLSGSISGGGALTKIGTGTLDLTGASDYAGGTTIQEGALLVDGSITSIVEINANTLLGGHGTVGGFVAESGATVAPGAGVPFSTLSVAGSVTFQPGSTYQVNVNPAGATDAINATGTATINGGTVTVAAAPGTYSTSTVYTILTAAGGRTGQFTALTTSGTPLAFLSPALSYDPTHAFLTFVQTASLPSGGTTPNQGGPAGTLNPTNPVFNPVLSLTGPGAQQAFNALSGEAHASAATAAVVDARFVSTAVFDRLWNIGGGELDAYQVLQGFGPTTLPTLLRCYAPNDTVTPQILSNYSVWGQAIGSFGRNDGNSNVGSLDRSTGGFVIGADKAFYGVLGNGTWRVGVAGGYSNDSFKVSDRSSQGTYESAFGTLYAGARYNAVDLRFGGSFGGNSTNIRRTVAFPGFLDAERANYGGETVQGFGEIGYRFALSRTVIEPIAGFTAVHVHQDSFRERGGAAALLGFGHDTDVQTTTLGFRSEASPFANLPIVARLMLGWQHAFGDINPTAVVAFASGGDPFEVSGAPIDRDAAVAEVGVEYRASSALTVGLNYAGQVGDHAYDNSVRGRLDYRF